MINTWPSQISTWNINLHLESTDSWTSLSSTQHSRSVHNLCDTGHKTELRKSQHWPSDIHFVNASSMPHITGRLESRDTHRKSGSAFLKMLQRRWRRQWQRLPPLTTMRKKHVKSVEDSCYSYATIRPLPPPLSIASWLNTGGCSSHNTGHANNALPQKLPAAKSSA